jgi:hypothetical protein
VDELNHLSWETWQWLTTWLRENRDSLELYELYKADPIYTHYVNEWWKEQGWTELPKNAG